MRDRLGSTINPGDVIAYATRTYDSGALHIGYVYEITLDEIVKIYILSNSFGNINFNKPTKTQLVYRERIIVLDKNNSEVQALLKKFNNIPHF